MRDANELDALLRAADVDEPDDLRTRRIVREVERRLDALEQERPAPPLPSLRKRARWAAALVAAIPLLVGYGAGSAGFAGNDEVLVVTNTANANTEVPNESYDDTGIADAGVAPFLIAAAALPEERTR